MTLSSAFCGATHVLLTADASPSQFHFGDFFLVLLLLLLLLLLFFLCPIVVHLCSTTHVSSLGSTRWGKRVLGKQRVPRHMPKEQGQMCPYRELKMDVMGLRLEQREQRTKQRTGRGRRLLAEIGRAHV